MSAWPRSLKDDFSSGFADFGEIMWRLIATSGEAAWIMINRLVSRGLEKDMAQFAIYRQVRQVAMMDIES
jgi:hypothetical protein